MPERAAFTAEYIRSFLDYNPETGIFLWKYRDTSISCYNNSIMAWNNKYAGHIAGCENKHIGYWVITVRYVKVYGHRLAWFYMTGEWPKLKIDHINGIKTDNRIANLRQVDDVANSINVKLRRDNIYGYKGINFDDRIGRQSRKKKWSAKIQKNKKTVYLGNFLTKEEAVNAYYLAAEKIHGEYRRIENA